MTDVVSRPGKVNICANLAYFLVSRRVSFVGQNHTQNVNAEDFD